VAGCGRIFADTVSGALRERPKLKGALQELIAGVPR
jgi:hypothetical protein